MIGLRTALILLLAISAQAHELQENRATLVLRDKTHVTITLYIAYTDALYQALAPQRPFAAFLLVYSAMKPDELQKELRKAETRFESATHLYLPTAAARPLTVTNWNWPDVKQVQTMLQQRMMQAIADPNGHSHETPIEVRAEANAQQEITALTIKLPEEFQRVLVVSYRPNQVWVDPKSPSPEIRF